MTDSLPPGPHAAIDPVAQAFDLGGVRRVEPWGSGLIHDSYRVTSRSRAGLQRTLVQRLNHEIFPDPPRLMASMERVTAHLRAKVTARGEPDPVRRVLTVLRTVEGEACWQGPTDGTWWRAFPFIEETRTVDQATTAAMARAAAVAFGAFQRDLADLPPPRLPEILPAFHDAARRLRDLRGAVEADVVGRAAAAGPEIEFAISRAWMTTVLPEAHAAGELPERVTHNDTKINNVLFDTASGEAICVIDLDTVMPGLGLYDFGDMVRTCTARTAEDERDLGRVHADPVFFEALADGYLESMGTLLTPAERELLPFAGRLMTYVVGLRFLTDFLEGDPYFRITRPRQNLDRARAQFALLRSLEAQDASLQRAIGERTP